MGVIPALSDTAPFSSATAGTDYFDSAAHYHALVREFENGFRQEKRLVFLTGDPAPSPIPLSQQFMAAIPALRRPTVIGADRAMSLHGLVARYAELLEAAIDDAAETTGAAAPSPHEGSTSAGAILIVDRADLLTDEVIAGLCRTAAAKHYAWPRTVLLSGDAVIAGLWDKVLSSPAAPIAAWHRLRRLAAGETDAFIKHQMDTAGLDHDALFKRNVVALIDAYADGDPAIVNHLARGVFLRARVAAPPFNPVAAADHPPPPLLLSDDAPALPTGDEVGSALPPPDAESEPASPSPAASMSEPASRAALVEPPPPAPDPAPSASAAIVDEVPAIIDVTLPAPRPAARHRSVLRRVFAWLLAIALLAGGVALYAAHHQGYLDLSRWDSLIGKFSSRLGLSKASMAPTAAEAGERAIPESAVPQAELPLPPASHLDNKAAPTSAAQEPPPAALPAEKSEPGPPAVPAAPPQTLAAPPPPTAAEKSEAPSPVTGKADSEIAMSLPPPLRSDVPVVPEPPLVALDGGDFMMGSDDDPTEKPAHRVHVKPFAIGKYPVTVAQWRQCVAVGACEELAGGDEQSPVSNVSWLDAQAYVQWLARTTHKNFRLPSEAEWEFAARGGTRTAFWWGPEFASGMASCKGCAGSAEPREPTRIGLFPANPYGLYDMTGPVAEWVSDCWHGDYRGAPRDGTAWLDDRCASHVLRGGSWQNDPSYLRSSSRDHYDTAVRYPTHGFRVALSKADEG